MRSSQTERHNKYINDYLALLGIKPENPSLSYLAKLQISHMVKVPFDSSNFLLQHPEDIALKRRVVLNQFKNQQGGICYQIHGAFQKLLRLLGFEVVLLAGAVFRNGDNEFPYGNIRRDTHCVLVVTIGNNEYLVDLAWSSALRVPLQVNGQPTNVKGEFPRRCVKNNNGYVVSVEIDGKWHVEYECDPAAKKPREFVEAIKFIASPRHHFSSTLLLMRYDAVFGQEYLVKSFAEGKPNHFSFHQTDEYSGETSKTKVIDAATLTSKLKLFGVPEKNCSEIIARSALKTNHGDASPQPTSFCIK